MEIMGVLLRQYKLDVKQWGREMGSFWTRVEKCKKRAVIELVQESFLQLSKRLQLLFLDLAFFMRRLSANDHGSLQAWNILSIMHDHSPDDIIMDMHDLRRHCFVEDVNVILQKGIALWKIHDVFLEFAESIPESSMYYVSARNCIHVNYMLPPPSSQALEFGLRAVVLELNEGHEKFEFWPGFSNVKALVFRNCRKLAVLGLKGLTSLVILHIDNCPSLKSIELPDHGADCRMLIDSVQYLRWVDTQGKNDMVMRHKKSNNMVQMYTEQGKQVVNNAWSWFAGMIGASHIERPARMEVGDLAFQMRMLQALYLQNTGIKDLGDLSMCWPLLRELIIIEKSLEHIEVGTLPYLKRFTFFCDDGTESNKVTLNKSSNFMYRKLKASPRGLKKKNLLVGCPALEDVVIRSVSLEDDLGTLVTPKLRSLWLANFWHAEKLPNVEACAESLQCLVVRECGELRSVDFMYRFESLSEFYLVGCSSITEISGLDCLPSLKDLYINNCINLQILSGLSGLVSLKKYIVGWGCPNLQVSLSGLESLTNLQILEQHCKNTLIRPGGFNVRKLMNLWRLWLITNSSAFDSTGANLAMGLDTLECWWQLNCEEVVTCETHCRTPLGVVEPPHLSCLTSILLEGVRNLTSLRGIGFLHPLRQLELKSLPNLSCLQGIESLTKLEGLLVGDCASVEELPNLSQLLNMSHLLLENCVKLRRVEGCNAMTNLKRVVLIGCKSMACFPLDYTTVGRLYPNWSTGGLRVEGSQFASREVLVSWILDDEESVVQLKKASVVALKWELCRNLRCLWGAGEAEKADGDGIGVAGAIL